MNRSKFWPALVLMLILLGSAGYFHRRANAHITSLDANVSLAEALGPDGTIKATTGNFNTEGYRMELAANGAPRFVPAVAPKTDTCWDTQFTLPNGTSGTVNALALLGGDIYVGGNFTAVGAQSLNYVARYSPGTNTWSALGTGSGSGVNATVNALAVIGSDLYVGGIFTVTNVGGTAVNANRVAKFTPATGAWSPLSATAADAGGVNGTVNALAVAGNDLYVGGSFTIANSGGATTVSANRVAKFTPATGVWSALGTGGGNGVDTLVLAMTVIGSDLYVGGSFTTANVGGTTVSVSNLAKFNTQTGAWAAVGTGGGNGVNNTVNTLTALGSDLYVGGSFTAANVGGTTVVSNLIARFDTLTNTWSTLGTGAGNGVNGAVNILAVIGSDLYVGGGFTTANVGGTAVGANRLAKFTPSTNTWSVVGEGGGNGTDGLVRALIASGNDLYVGGTLGAANVGGSIVRANNVARVNLTTGVWNALGTGTGNGLNNTVNALAVSGTDIYVGGTFTGVGNIVANRVAKFDTLTGTWSALGSGGGNGVGASVNALVAVGNTLYVGGAFSTANVGGTTVPTGFIARYDTLTNTWSGLGSGGGNGVSGIVNALAVSGSDLYVGGVFTSANAGTASITANRIAKVNTATGVWSALGTGGGNGVTGNVRALAVLGSDLYVGGQITAANAGGTTVTANRIAKVNTATGEWSALGTGGGNGVASDVNALAVIGSDLYVGGLFTTANVGGTSVTTNFVAKFTPSTGAWSKLGTGNGNGVNSPVSALAVMGNDLIVGGQFTSANPSGISVAANRVAKVNSITGLWTALGRDPSNGVDGSVTALALMGSNLFIGGTFGQAAGAPSANLARFLTNASPTIPTIAAANVSRQLGTSIGNVTIATVNDAEDAANTLLVTINGSNMATSNSVTLSNLAVSETGNVTADISVLCTGTTTTTFELRVTDVCGSASVSTLTVTLTANTAPTLIYGSPQTLAAGTGKIINPAFGPSDNGSISPLTVQSVGTYTGDITVNPTSGIITLANAGPVGSHVITIRATDGCNLTTDANITLNVINCLAITVNPVNPTLTASRVSLPYSQSFTQTGGSGAVNWSLSSGTLPNGLTLNGNSGLLSGTPTVFGTFNFTIRATDVNNCSGERPYSLTILPPCESITINPATLAGGFQNVAYNQTLTATGGTAPYSFAVTAGSLPNGLTLTSGGALAGTPTTLGTFNFTVTATESTGCTGTQAYTVVISGDGLMFYPLPQPVRLLETRAGLSGCTTPGAPINANGTLTLTAQGNCSGIPANAKAVTGNITVVPAGSGFLTLFPSNATRPTVANSNFASGDVTNNVFTVGLGTDGAFKIFSSATTEVIVDVTGYYAPPGAVNSGGLYFHPLTSPVRLLETRSGFNGCIAPGAPLTGTGNPNANPNLDFLVQGRSPVASPCNSIPATAQVLVGNATTVLPGGGGYLTIYPSGGSRPTVASSNYAGSDVVNGPFAVKLGTDGQFKIYTFATTHLVVDILGYYSEEAVDANGLGLLFTPLPAPVRLLETRPDVPGFTLTGCTRTNAKITGNPAAATHTQQAAGFCGLPNSAQAVVGNVSVVNTAGAGFLTLFPGNLTNAPLVATSNYPAPAAF
ncbi:MAG TPA: Ig domain-containing protein, partial [Blastocatellia bacterium]|nr:Ig domain-containing protein [Blastocatellia bacterium]